MRRIILLLLVLCSVNCQGQFFLGGTPVTPVVNPFTHSYSLVIDHTQCGSTNSSDFPVTVVLSDNTLKTTAFGGVVTSSNGYDINFSSVANYSSLLAWEVEYYSGMLGILVAHVRIPSVSASVNTTFYVGFGQASITTFQGGTGVWGNGFTSVYHLSNGTTLSAVDAVGTNNGVIHGTPNATTGQIDGGMHTGSTGNYVGTGITLPTTNFSFSIWGGNSNYNVVDFYNRPCGAADCMTGAHGVDLVWGALYPDNVYVVVRQNSGAGSGDINANCPGLSSGWHQLFFVMDATLGALIYYDGQLAGSNNYYTSISTGGLTFNIGQRGDVCAEFFTGDIDEVRVNSVVRSADWILTEYNNQRTPGNIGAPGFYTANFIY